MTFVAVVSGVVAGCSGAEQPSAAESLKQLGVADSPETVLAVSVQHPRESLVMGSDLDRKFLRVQYAVRGYSWADAACATDKVVTTIGRVPFEALTVGEIQKLDRSHPEVVTSARACASPDSATRIGAPTPKGATSAPHPAPDLDGTAVRDMFAGLYAATARQVGFTAAERACVLRNLVDATSPDEFVKIVTGAEQQSSESVGKKIRSCVNAARLDVLVPKAAKAMLADRAAAKAEHDRKQAQLNAEIDALNRSSTTTR